MFQLSDFRLELLVWLMTVVAVILTVIYWHKLALQKWHHITARFTIIIFIQILALTATGITINRSGEFYASWGDLFGSNNHLAKVAIASQALSTISSADIARARLTPGGSLIFREVITGAASNISDVVYVVLSPKIAARLLANPDRPSIGKDYKVIALFPGYPGSPSGWINSMQGVTTLERIEALNSVMPTILIIPTINVLPGVDTECMNFAGGAQVETWLTNDVRTFASKFLGLDTRPWNSFGYSTGGWCAAMLAIRHPDIYRMAVSIAGYFEPDVSASHTKRERNFLAKEYNLIALLTKHSAKPKLMIITSVKDKFSYESTKYFIKNAGSLIGIRYVPIPQGGHNTKVWIPYVATGYLWIDPPRGHNSIGP